MVVGSRRTHQEEEGLEVADMATLPHAEFELMEQGQELATDPFPDVMTPSQFHLRDESEQQVKGGQEQKMMNGGMEQGLNGGMQHQVNGGIEQRVNGGTEQQANGGSDQPSEDGCSCVDHGRSERPGSRCSLHPSVLPVPVTSRQTGRGSMQQMELLDFDLPQHHPVLDDIDMKLWKGSSCGWKVCSCGWKVCGRV